LTTKQSIPADDSNEFEEFLEVFGEDFFSFRSLAKVLCATGEKTLFKCVGLYSEPQQKFVIVY